jgi:hypothetical protein
LPPPLFSAVFAAPATPAAFFHAMMRHATPFGCRFFADIFAFAFQLTPLTAIDAD